MTITYSNDFWYDPTKDDSRVFQIFPTVNGDSRGNFTEIFKLDTPCVPEWMTTANWIKQINRSESVPNVFRGMHAQKGKFCQSKLVECVAGDIVDVILDARPNSDTFGKCKCFDLSSTTKNRLFVPRGFLHGFYVRPSAVPMGIFLYFIGGAVYNKQSEVSVNPRDVLDIIGSDIASTSSSLVLSDKDLAGLRLQDFLDDAVKLYKSGSLWFE